MATKQGTAKNDTLTGTNSKDRLAGLEGNDLLRGLAGADELFGGAGVDRLEGGADNDYLDGGTGDDDLRGGKGNDVYVVDHAKDITLTLSDPGVDRVFASITYTLGAQQEELVLIGKTKINGTGNAGDNFLVGNDGTNILSGMAGRDELNGGKGRDVLRGGAGDDAYVIDHATEIERGRADPGRDRVYASVSYTLGAHQEDLVLLREQTTDRALAGTGNAGNNDIEGNRAANVLRGMAGDDRLFGGEGADTLIGDQGNDELYGGAGIDRLSGGDGDDYYRLDDATEIAKSETDDGDDTVEVNFDYQLGAHQENLVISQDLPAGTVVRITGNGGVNFLGGTPQGGDELFGGEGNDFLNGGAGDDDLRGEGGDDTYFIDNAGDITKSELDPGTDRVNSAVNDYTLGEHQEELFLTGTALKGTGNGGANWLVGNNGANELRGGDGGDLLDGGAGDDDLRGEGGDDAYVVDHEGDINKTLSDPGRDLVNSFITYTLGNQQEDLALQGSANLNGTGNGLANSLTGNSGENELRGGDGNDELNGGAGRDRLLGEGGDDTYLVDDNEDILRSDADPGRDRVKSIVSYVLGDEQEELELGGTANLSGIGNGGDNLLIGNSGQNELRGGEGDDTLNGGGGDDDLRGEGGDDIYSIDHTDDIGAAPDPGRDRVNSSITYTLGAEQEELVLSGTGNLNGTGNGGNNLLVGNSGVNELRGGAGDDELRGAGGADSLFGEAGSDLLNYSAAAVLLDGGADVDGLFLKGTGPTNLLDLTAAGGPQITDIEDIVFDLAGGNDAAQRAQTYTLRVAAGDVLDMSSTSDLMKVLGEAGDKIELSGGGWVEDTVLAQQQEQALGVAPGSLQAWTNTTANGIAQIVALDVIDVVPIV